MAMKTEADAVKAELSDEGIHDTTEFSRLVYYSACPHRNWDTTYTTWGLCFLYEF